VLRYREFLLLEGDVPLVSENHQWGGPSQDPHYLSNMYTMQATKSSVVDPRVVPNGVGRHRVEGPLSLIWGQHGALWSCTLLSLVESSYGQGPMVS
jgi:hypothetical protein